MTWAISGSPIRYFFEASLDSKVKSVPRQEFLEFVKDNPDVMFNMLYEAYIGIDGLRQRFVHLMGGNAKSRLLISLVLEAQSFGQSVGKDKYAVTINEEELGNRAGISRETVSRELSRMEKQNFVTIGNEGIIFNLKEIDELLASGS